MKFTRPDCETCKSRGSSLFHYCHLDELETMSNRKTCTYYKTGQSVFHEAVMPVGLFCVNSGKIKLHKMGTDGKEQIVRLVKPGDILGYRALMSDTPYSASATVLEDATVCMIPREVFFSILKENNQISDGLMKILCRTIKESETKLTEMAYKPVRERLAEALLYLLRTYAEEKDPEPFTMAMTREDLASLVGTAKETVIRLLSQLKSEGIVQTQGRKITILKEKELARISNMYD